MWLGEAGFDEREEAGLWAGEPDGKMLPFAEIGGRGGTDRFLADQQWVCGLEGAGSGSGQHWREEPGQGLSLVHLKIRGLTGCLTSSACNKRHFEQRSRQNTFQPQEW